MALSRQLGMTLEEAKAFIKHYFERFAGVRAWLDKTVDEARQRGFVETLVGRRRYIPELRDRNFSIRSFGERTATNSPLQGSAADLIKIAMIGILASIAIPKFTNTKQKAYVAQMKSDLKNLATAEEAFFYDSTFYTTSLAALNNFNASTGVTLTVLAATPGGWSAQAVHAQTTRQCALFQGNAPPIAPAVIEGRSTCT